MIIGVVGFIDSGKGTVGDILVNEHGFKQIAFADALKDAVASIFGWSRHMLEGDTPESRAWREQPDEWWSARFGYEVTPRLMLQHMGTEATRRVIADNIWVAALERRLRSGSDYVITDVRFPNEMEFVRSVGGKLIWVKRGTIPTKDELLNMHVSETAWYNELPTMLNYMIENDGTIDDLKVKVDEVLTTITKQDTIFHHSV